MPKNENGLLLCHCQVRSEPTWVDPGSRWSKGRSGYSRVTVLNYYLTNLGLGVIRPTQRLASSPVTDRITLNHLHSRGGMITFSAGCNHKPCVDVGNTLRMKSG